MTNKEASYRQEHMVADYMSWNVVSGSGSRPFTPGDITSDHFLVECKTHIKKQDKICFKLTHWTKICEEARSKNKLPLLVTDDGSQRYNHTWIMTPLKFVQNCTTVNVIDGWNNTSRSGNTIIFDDVSAKQLYLLKSVPEQTSVFVARWNADDDYLAIMPLREFREFYERQFQ